MSYGAFNSPHKLDCAWWQYGPGAMNRENRPLVPDEPVEFEKQPMQIQDFPILTDAFIVIAENSSI